MNPRDAVNDDDQFSLLLERYNDILSAGGEVDPSSFSSLSSQLQDRLRRALRCLHLLRQFPSSFSHAPTLVVKADITPHSGILGGMVGRFRILRRLGHGGGGIVFLAFDPDLQREVALKVPHLPALLESETRRRFLREARAAAGLDHPNLVPVHEAGESNGVCFLVSTYCRGGSLAQWLASRTQPVPARQAAELLVDLAVAVQHINDRGIYHRDIKPGNILLDPRTVPTRGEPAFVPRLTDFGLAKLREAQTESTCSGVVLGTLSYMAPEQVEGRVRDIGPATDVYGLGGVLYEMLAGRSPFRGATDADTLRQVLTQEPVSPRRMRRDVPLDLETICLKCLEKEPALRYGSAAALAEDLRRFLAHEPIQARQLGRSERLRKWVRCHPAKTILCAFGLILGLLLAIGWFQLESLKRARDVDRMASSQQDEERQQTIRQRERHLRQLRYADDVVHAWRDWENRRLEKIADFLDRYRPSVDLDPVDDLRGFEWYFLSRQVRTQPRPMLYPAAMFCAVFSPDGTTCACGYLDGSIVLWDASSGRQCKILRGHTISVLALAYSPDGRYLASGSATNVAGKLRGELLLWDTRTGNTLPVFPSSLGAIDSLAFSAEGRTLATGINRGSGRGEVKFWEIPSGALQTTIPFSARGAISVAFASDGKTVAVGHADGRLSLCDSVKGQVLDTRSGHEDFVWSVVCGHKDAMLVSGGHDGKVRLWSLRRGDSFRREYPHGGKVWSVALSPDDRGIAAVSHGMLKVWDRETQRELCSHTYEKARSVAFSLDGERLAVGDENGRLWMYDLSFFADGRLSMRDTSLAAETLVWQGHHDGKKPCEAWAIAFSPDGKVLASAGDDHVIRFWDPASGRERAILRGHQSLVSSLAFSPDGKLLASGSFDEQATLKLWNGTTGAEIAALRGHTKPVYAVAFSPEGKWLATAGRDLVVRLWDVATRRQHPIFSNNHIEALAFSPDGRTLAVWDESQSLLLWDMVEQKVRRTLPRHPRGRVAVAFSPDGKTLVTGDYEGTVRFFDAPTCDLRLSVRSHADAVNCLAFSPDSKTLASAGFDKKVKLWQTASGRELLTLPEQKDRVRWLTFSPDGTMLATAGHDGILTIYRAESRDEAQSSK